MRIQFSNCKFAFSMYLPPHVHSLRNSINSQDIHEQKKNYHQNENKFLRKI